MSIKIIDRRCCVGAALLNEANDGLETRTPAREIISCRAFKSGTLWTEALTHVGEELISVDKHWLVASSCLPFGRTQNRANTRIPGAIDCGDHGNWRVCWHQHLTKPDRKINNLSWLKDTGPAK